MEKVEKQTRVMCQVYVLGSVVYSDLHRTRCAKRKKVDRRSNRSVTEFEECFKKKRNGNGFGMEKSR